MKIHYFLWLVLALSACSGTEQESKEHAMPEAIKQLNWVKSVDFYRDVDQALKNKDYRLLAISLRGTVLPGIASEDLKRVQKQCKHRFLPGMGDVIINKEHQNLWQKGKEYAEQYNILMVKHCLKD